MPGVAAQNRRPSTRRVKDGRDAGKLRNKSIFTTSDALKTALQLNADGVSSSKFSTEVLQSARSLYSNLYAGRPTALTGDGNSDHLHFPIVSVVDVDMRLALYPPAVWRFLNHGTWSHWTGFRLTTWTITTMLVVGIFFASKAVTMRSMDQACYHKHN